MAEGEKKSKRARFFGTRHEGQQLQDLNELLLRAGGVLDRLEKMKGDASPELKKKLLVLCQKSEKIASEIVDRIEKLETSLREG